MNTLTRSLFLGGAIALLLIPSDILAEEPDPLQQGFAAYQEGRYEDALELILPLAEEGNPIAQNVIGAFHLNAWGVDRDIDQALQWFEKSAAQGNPRAFYNLGATYLKGNGVDQDCDKALGYFLRPAENGNAIAQVNLAGLYADGNDCMDQDPEEGVRWYRAAAEQGDPLGLHSLGAMYALGKGVKQDFVEAMAWYRKAAEQGYPASQFTMGTMYQSGEGVERDLQEATRWYRLAAEQGHEKAQAQLERIEAMMDPGSIDQELVAAYLMAPPEDLAVSRSRLATLSMMVSSGLNVQYGDEEINDQNREEIAAGINAKLIAQQIALTQRGSRDIHGQYNATATESCSKIQSGWADGIAQGALVDTVIKQDKNDFQIVQKLKIEGRDEHEIETPGVVVEDAIVFADMMNSDFMFVGHVSDDAIVIAPDTDFILDSWPDWVKAPGKRDLNRCEVTLSRISN